MEQLYAPPGINFECTSCGNCCLQWPVPVTADDIQRMNAALAPSHAGVHADRLLVRELQSSDPKLASFAFTLEKRGDGRCQFLTDDSRCWLHANYGPDLKPSMCRLFPYTFTATPSGVYASVSFASTGTLLNAGRPLSEQTDMLRAKWQEFRALFPDLSLDWSRTQIVDGEPISWLDYLGIERDMLAPISGPGKGRTDRLMAQIARGVAARVPRAIDLEKAPPVGASAKMVDQILIKHLSSLYLPDDVFGSETVDFDARALLEELMAPPQAVQLEMEGMKISIRDLLGLQLGDMGAEAEDLMRRFLLCRIFSKLYFGPGYANLSLLAGIHHLCLLVALVRIRCKFIAIKTRRKPLDFWEVAEVVRALERRLTLVSLSADSATVLEVLLTSPERAARILYLAD